MKFIFKIIVAICFITSSHNAFAQLNFYPSNKDFNSAVNAAKVLNKLLFIEFYTDWCINCKKMEANVFNDPELSSYINANYVPIKLNAELFSVMDICEQYKIQSYPTILIIDPKSKKELNKLVGYYGVMPLTAEVKKTIYKNKR